MKSLGIEPDEGLFYEGDNNYGRGIHPSPSVLIASVLNGPNAFEIIPESESLGLAQLVFREDHFDPIARVRRGRFYERTEPGQPHQWYVQPHPLMPIEAAITERRLRSPKQLHGFYAWPARARLTLSVAPSLVALGTLSAHTIWRPVAIERIVTGEDLVTLRARSTLSALPEIDQTKVPTQELSRVTKSLDALVNSANSESPGSLVESARKATQCCLGVWLAHRLGDSSLTSKDIGDLVRKLPPDLGVMGAVATIVARFHVREKPNEQVRLGTREVVEGDGEFALAAVSLLLREIGWAV